MTTSRVRYLEGQVLHAVDLTAEQADRRERRRLHNNAQHGWGIVHGLGLSPAGSGVAVAPGMAIDGHGRDLVLPDEWVFSSDDLAAVSAECVSLWLIGCSVPEPVRGHGDQDCDPGRFAGLREAAAVLLDVCASELISEPVELAPQERPHPPHLPAPEGRGWPIFLGAVKLKDGSWSLVSAEQRRPYVSLNGWRVETPRGDVRLQIGNEVGTDRNRFAVATAGANDAWEDRLKIDTTGRTTIHGDLDLVDLALVNAVFDGDNKLVDGRLVPLASANPKLVHAPLTSGLVVAAGGQAVPAKPVGIALSPPVETPKEALPWRIYRTTVKENEQQIDELRIEILDPGTNGDPARDLFAIGHYHGATFVPCLTVRADCGVTISGDLVVDGEIVQAPIPDDPTDPRFDEALAEAVAEGAATGYLSVPPSQVVGLVLGFDAPAEVCAGQDVDYVVTVRNDLANAITSLLGYSTITLNGTHVQPKKIGEVAGLAAGASLAFDVDTAAANAQVGEVTIAVTAIGIGPGPVIVYGVAEHTVGVVLCEPDIN